MTFRRLWSAVACLLLICGCQSTDLASQSLNPLRTPKTSSTDETKIVSADEDVAPAEPSGIALAEYPGAPGERDFIEQVSATKTEPPRDQQLDAAHAELKAGRRESAAELFERVLDRTPDHPRAHHGLAVIADADGRYPDAEFHYKRALEQLPHDPNLLNDLGYSYLLQDRLNEAESFLETATRIQPMHDLAHVNRARLAYRRGQTDMAGRMLADRFGDEQAAKMMTSLAEWDRELPGGSGSGLVGNAPQPRQGGSGSILYGTGAPATAGQGAVPEGASQNGFSATSQNAAATELPVMPTIRQRATSPNSNVAQNNSSELAQAPSPGASPPLDASWDQVMMAAQAEAERARRARLEQQSGPSIQPNTLIQRGAMMQPNHGMQNSAAMAMAPQGLPYPPQQPFSPQQNGLAGQQPPMTLQAPRMTQPPGNYGLGRQPMYQQSNLQHPVMQQSVMQQPVVQQPVVQQPAMQQPVVQQPATQQPTFQSPVMQQPVVQQPVMQPPMMQLSPVRQLPAPAPNSQPAFAPVASTSDARAGKTFPSTEMTNVPRATLPGGISGSVQMPPASAPVGVPMGNVVDSTNMEQNSNSGQYPIYGPGMSDPAAAGTEGSHLRTSTFDGNQQTNTTRVPPGILPGRQRRATTQTQIAGLNAGPGGLFPIGVSAGQTTSNVPGAQLTAAPPMMTVPHDHPGSMTNINGAMYQAPVSVLGTQSGPGYANATGVTTPQPTIPPIQMPSPRHMMLSHMQGNGAVIPVAGAGTPGGVQHTAGTMPTNGSTGIATAVYPGQTPSGQGPSSSPSAAGGNHDSTAQSAAFEQLLNQLRTGQ